MVWTNCECTYLSVNVFFTFPWVIVVVMLGSVSILFPSILSFEFGFLWSMNDLFKHWTSEEFICFKLGLFALSNLWEFTVWQWTSVGFVLLIILDLKVLYLLRFSSGTQFCFTGKDCFDESYVEDDNIMDVSDCILDCFVNLIDLEEFVDLSKEFFVVNDGRV